KTVLATNIRASSLVSRTNRMSVVGHRGASDSYPENTVLSIERAIADGADAVEFDIQLTLDKEIIVLHDSLLDRTTTGEGKVSTKNFHGYIEFLTTKKPPHCKIPRFEDVLDVFLRPENSKVWAVIDVKLDNSPEVLEILSTIFKKHGDLSHFRNQFYIGIWHPKFVPISRNYLPELPIIHIGFSLNVARKYFPDVDGYNMLHIILCDKDGKKFIENAHELSKPVFTWTVNKEHHATNCYNYGVDAIMTDRPKYFVSYLREGGKSSSNWFSAWIKRFFYSALKFFVDYMCVRKLKQYGDLDVPKRISVNNTQ
ncbi:302_t:CDS:2, partial [Acaulospora morrowiae]